MLPKLGAIHAKVLAAPALLLRSRRGFDHAGMVPRVRERGQMTRANDEAAERKKGSRRLPDARAVNPYSPTRHLLNPILD